MWCQIVARYLCRFHSAIEICAPVFGLGDSSVQLGEYCRAEEAKGKRRFRPSLARLANANVGQKHLRYIMQMK